MVYVDLEHAFGRHHDTGHHKSSNNSIALHVNCWISHDYIPGDNNSGTWMKCVPKKPLCTKKET